MRTSGACFLDVTFSTLAISNSARTAACSELPPSAQTRVPPRMASKLLHPSQGVPALVGRLGIPRPSGSRTTTATQAQCRPGATSSARGREGSAANWMPGGQLPGRSRTLGGAAGSAAALSGPVLAGAGASTLVRPPAGAAGGMRGVEAAYAASAAACAPVSPPRPSGARPAAAAAVPAAFLRLDQAEANFSPQRPASPLSPGGRAASTRGLRSVLSSAPGAGRRGPSLWTISKPCFLAQATTASNPPLATETCQ
mmetsp:Transcript_109450/g.349226  ORF Transcript_109450/g.349226 Transcript_109450/m.349226 type:complete len:255 (+) Transcript_109450:1929-2693(+)